MRTLKKPWIAYKVMAAGVIYPKDGFKYAFDNRADFQVRKNTIIARTSPAIVDWRLSMASRSAILGGTVRCDSREYRAL